jgi:CDP-diacylglycerol--glycerol-3-phosphate 3-phosphatidyltransferase
MTVTNGTGGRQWASWPNLITALRIVGSPGLVVLAMARQPIWMGFLVILLVLTEWLDGFLARRLHEDSAFGARLDTIADALFYSSLLVAIHILNPALVGREATWILAAIGSYLYSWLASLTRFRRLPSYHTWAAKGVWIVVGIGILCLFTGWSEWPFRLATVCVVLANLEATLITFVLSECTVNVPSIWHALRLAKES